MSLGCLGIIYVKKTTLTPFFLYAQIPGFRGFPEESNKAYVVLLVLEDGLTPPAAVHGMIPCIRVLDSQRSDHILISSPSGQ